MSLKEEVKRGREVGHLLFTAFKNPDHGVFGRTQMPEDLPPSGVEKGSNSHMQFITQVVAIDYLKDAHLLWQNARKAYITSESHFLFDIPKVMNSPLDKIASALKSNNMSRYAQSDAKIWQKIAQAIHTHFADNIKGFCESQSFSAKKILEYLRASKNRQDFPYLKGDKIGALWIRMLQDVCKIQFQDIELLPIPVDIHVARATFTTGILWGKFEGSIKDIFQQIQSVWFEIAKGSKYIASDFDESLWHLSKFGCEGYTPTGCPNKVTCPVGKFCVKGPLRVAQKKDGVMLDTTIL